MNPEDANAKTETKEADDLIPPSISIQDIIRTLEEDGSFDQWRERLQDTIAKSVNNKISYSRKQEIFHKLKQQTLRVLQNSDVLKKHEKSNRKKIFTALRSEVYRSVCDFKLTMYSVRK